MFGFRGDRAGNLAPVAAPPASAPALRGKNATMMPRSASPFQAKSLNDAHHAPARTLANGVALNAETGAPEWVQLLPKGPDIVGRDGRRWRLPSLETALAMFTANRGPLVIDYEHGQDIAAKSGDAAPAAGWIEALEDRAGELWGRVAWTAKAAAHIAAREYRFLSPALAVDPSTSEIGYLLGAALVNRPNLVMAALNSQQEMQMEKSALALGLAAGATDVQIAAAIEALKAEKVVALNAAATPSLEKFVPRGDYEVALNRASTAEAKIAAIETAGRDAEIEREIVAAIAAGKITPASRDFYVATCRAENGLASFRSFVAAQPSVFKTSGLDNRDADKKAANVALNSEQDMIAAMMGVDKTELAKHLAAQAV